MAEYCPLSLAYTSNTTSVELIRTLALVVAAEERRVGAISIEVFSWLTDFYLKPDLQSDLKRRFLAAAVNSTKVSYTLSDSEEVSHAYNLLTAILPHVKSLTPSLYAQAAAQLSSLVSRVSSARSQGEEIDERIRTSNDPLGQIIAEARSATNPTLKDELFLQAARLALEKGMLKQSLELAMSMSDETGDIVTGFMARDLAGNSINVQYGHDSPKRVLLFFSPTCRYSASQFVSWIPLIQNSLQSRTEVLLIATDTEQKSEINNFLGAVNSPPQSAGFKVALIPTNVREAYKFSITPTTVVVSSEGVVQNAWNGLVDLTQISSQSV